MRSVTFLSSWRQRIVFCCFTNDDWCLKNQPSYINAQSLITNYAKLNEISHITFINKELINIYMRYAGGLLCSCYTKSFTKPIQFSEFKTLLYATSSVS